MQGVFERIERVKTAKADKTDKTDKTLDKSISISAVYEGKGEKAWTIRRDGLRVAWERSEGRSAGKSEE